MLILKKGIQIQRVDIDFGRITITTNVNEALKFTRAQRNVFIRWKDNPNYETEIVKAFSNDKILSPDFIVVQDGELVYKKK